MRARYSAAALLHIASIHRYIDDRNPVAAARVVARIRSAAEGLEHFPERGRNGTVPGTREWVVHGLPYVLVYEIEGDADELVILGVFHGAQRRPGQE